MISQPASTLEELRAALVQPAPDVVATFGAERADALQQGRYEVSAAPMHRFVGRWAISVAVERFPDSACAEAGPAAEPGRA